MLRILNAAKLVYILGYKLGYKKDHIQQRGRSWYYYRRVPKEYAHLDQRKFVKQSLRTDSEAVAVQRARMVNEATEQYWLDLMDSVSDDAKARYDAAIRLARTHGFSYRPVRDIADGNLAELAVRMSAIEKLGAADISAANADAILGGIEPPKLTLSGALEEFWKLSEHETRTKTERELRRWKNPRKKAVKNFIAVIDDRELADITRNDAIDFRAWWVDRIAEENLTAYAANKDIQHLSGIFSTVNDDLRLGLANPFERLRLSEKNEGGNRVPFSADDLRVLLDLNKLTSLGLSLEAIMLIFAATDTGCGPSELTGLDPAAGDIQLDTPIPFIHIRANEYRALKNNHRDRTIPLVGASLYAFQKCPDGFPSYRGKADSASTWINKVLREGCMYPLQGHSLYSLRHSFEDRLTAVETPDKIAAALMGHSYHRPRYGQGPSLDLKKQWLEKIAFQVKS